jgi:hypothetical protein
MRVLGVGAFILGLGALLLFGLLAMVRELWENTRANRHPHRSRQY